jgi:phospho-N-acetylmuramoyl-pentapeptide-transferase
MSIGSPHSLTRLALNVLRYITFRTGGAMITGLSRVPVRPWIIDHLRSAGQGPADRSDGPQSHLVTKKARWVD